MIFVTVGTHEQQFDRLVRAVDELKGSGEIADEVVIQTGYSEYEPRHSKWSAFFPYGEMSKLMSEARIVITHGGPSSFITALQEGKVPIVVPRQKRFGEHVNDHQLDFCRKVAEIRKNIILCEDTADLGRLIKDYGKLSAEMAAYGADNLSSFIEGLEKMVEELLPIDTH